MPILRSRFLGTFGSRQEEAQRLGRILRPKGHDNTAVFYSLISRDTNEERFGQNRQLFLTEQGYEYEIYTLDQFREAQEELAQLQLNNV